MRSTPDFRHEDEAIAQGARLICGVDEVGRGPLAGPVTAAAVILPRERVPEGLNDSKQLGPGRRARLAEQIMACADWAVAHATVEEIEQLNISQAAHLAMIRAIQGLRQRPCLVLVDGKHIPRALNLPARAIVKGDTLSLTIAAASIIAKEARDRIMVDLAQQHPGYGWEHNMGYPTKEHRAALQHLGITPAHRRTFKPVHKMLCLE